MLGGQTLRSDTQSWWRLSVAGHDQNIAVIFNIVDIFIRLSKVEGIKVNVLLQILSQRSKKKKYYVYICVRTGRGSRVSQSYTGRTSGRLPTFQTLWPPGFAKLP